MSSSVEGMWKFQSADVSEPGVFRWGSILVLESGRVFGGDSVMAHVGTYEVDRDIISARARSWVWNFDVGDVTNVFGMTGEIDYNVVLQGRRDTNVIAGVIAPELHPEFQLAFRMEKIAELP